MATDLKHRKLGYADYERIPPDGKRHEILDGELYVTPAPAPLHQRLSKRLQRQLEAYFESRGLAEVFNAPVDLILGEHDIVQPDLLGVADPAQVTSRAIEKAPLLVVEVLSPSTRALDRAVKMRRYAELGIRHYWILDPEIVRLECLRLDAGVYRAVAEASAPDQLRLPEWPELVIDLAALSR
ncbi:MAG: Uma2 family endonuclease [Candidatus Rokubacteria bacterium]|nr:Uma2 family endonuclease [Candidatus Rokubacteria bacterium]